MQYEIIGCCDSYVACSDARKCLYPEEWFAKKCCYRKNLEAGRIFYGKYAGEEPNKETVGTALYLKCYERLFAVRAKRGYYGLSYKLSQDQYRKLKKFFSDNEVPFETDLSDELCKIESDPPAIARVVVQIGDEKFNILNYNSYLIQEKFANGIYKAFKAIGVNTWVDTNRSYRKKSSESIVNITSAMGDTYSFK